MSTYIPVMAADSKMFVRGLEPHTFKGCLGVCLGFPSPKNFKSNYWKFMASLLEEIEIDPTRKIIKSYDLRKIYGDRNSDFLENLEKFILFLSQNDVVINTVFTTLNTKKMPMVSKYGHGKFPSTEIKAIEFIDTLHNYYPYIATWKVSKTAYLKGVSILLDSLTSEITHAWNELCTHHEIQIIPKGDLCNPFISSADLALRYVDEYLSLNHLHLNEDSIEKCFNDLKYTRAHTYYVGHPEINQIVPIEKRQININDYYSRPMIYILKESKFGNQFVENSKLWSHLLNFACDKETGLKFIDYGEDHKYIKDGDYLIYIGNEGEAFGQNLLNVGYNINLLSSRQILSKQPNV